jgi:multidrug efflux pump subunit AcrA (membrane-fusion protein)
MKKVFKIIMILLVIGLIGFLGYSYIANRVKTNLDDFNESMKWYTKEYTAKKEMITDYVKGTSEVMSFNIQQVNSEGYTIKEKYVNDGDTVTAKQKIMKINNEYETKTLTSNINGIYFETIGDMEQKTYVIYDTSNIGVELNVEEKEVVKLALGQKVDVKVVVLNKDIEGTVSYISKLPQSGKYKVRITIPYSDDLRFGYGTTIKVLVKEKEVLTIPYSCVQYNGSKYYVLKKENRDLYEEDYDDRYLTEVQIGTINGKTVEIVSGLNEGDIVMGYE